MPRIFISQQFEFFFYSNDHEPIHVHVTAGGCSCRVEVGTLSVTRNKGFNSKQLKRITDTVLKNELLITEVWNDFFSQEN